MTVDFGGTRLQVPEGAVIGVAGLTGSGIEQLLRAASGARQYSLDGLDPVERGRAAMQIARARQSGASVLVITSDDRLLSMLCDEVWWIHGGKLAAQGDPAEVLERYNRFVAQELRGLGEGLQPELRPSLRRGDGRAELIAVETIGAAGAHTMTWTSGEEATVRVHVRFHGAVENPVVGIMIRTRVGSEVYGTNTELEQLKLGPCRPGDEREIRFTFTCDLCPGEYTLTAASHDSDGVWHDWLEDALAFTVVDSRYTAGVANLRARVEAVAPPVTHML